jgi:hypothetical protein
MLRVNHKLLSILYHNYYNNRPTRKRSVSKVSYQHHYRNTYNRMEISAS